MHLSNVIFKDDKLEGFIDFEILENNVKIFDLCYCCTSILSELFSDERLRGNGYISLAKSLKVIINKMI